MPYRACRLTHTPSPRHSRRNIGNARAIHDTDPEQSVPRPCITVMSRHDTAGPVLRHRIFRRDGYRCVYCDAVFDVDGLTVDHVEPKMRGGDRSDGNLVTCCRACNAAKGGQPAWLYLGERPAVRETFLRNATHVWPRLRRAIEQAAQSKKRSRRPKLQDRRQ